MKVKKGSLILFLAAVLLLSTFHGAVAGSGAQEEPELAQMYGDIDTSTPELTTIIVELTEESVVEAELQGIVQTLRNVKNSRQEVLAELEDKVSELHMNREYDYLISGMSIELPANEIPQVLAVEGVRAVYEDVEYTTDEIELSEDEVGPFMFDSAPFIGADQVWEEMGVTGEGVTVAIIDTGVDYTHPDLEHAFDDYKGWDFVDDNDDPQETPPGDPRGAQTDHGTHVAGTVAANGEIKGVAPDATLLAYRVLGPGGSGTTTNVVASIEKAVEDGADVMNLSLGNTLNNPDWATSLALDRAMADGVVAVTSNGNSGPANWTVGSPGTSRDAISVGASALPYLLYGVEVTTAGEAVYPSAKMMAPGPNDEILDLDGNEYTFVEAGLGMEEDFEGLDVEGKIALISRGEIPFVDKARHAREAGAIGAVIYNNVDGDLNFYIPDMVVPTVQMTREDGQKMLDELAAGHDTITFAVEELGMVDETVADFSSRGPVIDTWMIKPDVVAPGVNITSTIPTHNPDEPHGYGAKQGTSMAAPHVAGAAALLLQANENWGVDRIKASLMNTAEKISDPDGNIYPRNTQGAGSIRVPAAILTDTLITPGSHSFGTFKRERGQQMERSRFTVENLSAERKRYSVEVEFDGNPKGIQTDHNKSLFLIPGQSRQVDVRVIVNASQLEQGHYEGTIRITDGENTYEVPTILFVQEPDYPRITALGIEALDDGYELEVYLPRGAEELEVHVYDAELNHVGLITALSDLPALFNTIEWDGTIDGEELDAGDYYIAAFATKAGQTDYVLEELSIQED